MSRANCKTPLRKKIALLTHFATQFLRLPYWAWSKKLGAGHQDGPRKLCQNHRFSWVGEFCNCLSRKAIFLALIPLILFAAEDEPPDFEKMPAPWFTGPLLAASGNVVQVGHYNIEPYFFAIANTARYNNDWKAESIDTLWNLSPQLLMQVGIAKWLDFQIIPTWFWNYRKGAAHWELGDTPAQFDFQLYQDQLPHRSWLPSIRLTLRETIPLGRYRNLQAKNRGTDIGGGGSWVTSASINISRLIQIRSIHYVSFRANFALNIPAPVHVKNLNTYGGGPGTNGKVYPGINGDVDVAVEYNLTQNWALACDLVGVWSSKTRFSGHMGPAHVGRKAFVQYSIAPAIEYNWSRNLGIIGGVWLTLAGKNASKFSSGVIALNYYN